MDTKSTLMLHVTSKCNNKCKNCLSSDVKNLNSLYSMSNEEVDKFIYYFNKYNFIDNIHTISIFGGEPLMWNNLCDNIYKIKQNIPKINLHLTTNGRLINTINTSILDLFSSILISVYSNCTQADIKYFIHLVNIYNIEKNIHTYDYIREYLLNTKKETCTWTQILLQKMKIRLRFRNLFLKLCNKEHTIPCKCCVKNEVPYVYNGKYLLCSNIFTTELLSNKYKNIYWSAIEDNYTKYLDFTKLGKMKICKTCSYNSNYYYNTDNWEFHSFLE